MSASGSASDVQIQSGGTQTVAPGGTVSNTTVTGAGASQVISANAQAVGGHFADGGTQTVYGRAAQAQVSLGGKQTVQAGGIATDSMVNGSSASQTILAGGEAVDAHLSAGATQIVYGTAIGTTLGGSQTNANQTNPPEAPPITMAPPVASPVISPAPSPVAAPALSQTNAPVTANNTAAPFIMWSLFANMAIGPQIQQWGETAGWQVTWSGGMDPMIPQNHYYFGGFEQAVRDMVAGLSKEGTPVWAKFDSINHVVTLGSGQP